MDTISTVASCRYRMRVEHRKDAARFHNHDMILVLSTLKGSVAATNLHGVAYVGFDNHASMMSALTASIVQGWRESRLIDPYALYVGFIAPRHTLKSIADYFARFGRIMCVSMHYSSDGTYCFVNFAEKFSAMRAIARRTHYIDAMRVPVRAKTLTVAEPFAAAPWSPSRW